MDSFRSFLVAEMTKRNKMHNVEAAPLDDKMVIKASGIKVSTGHQQPSFRTGTHQDKRLRRQKTRQGQRKQWRKEQG
jgi:hypothetical protein